MGGQLDGNFLPGSLPHKFILIVILIICFVVNKFLSPSLPSLPLEVSPLISTQGAPAKIEFGAFLALNMSSGGNNINDFSENHLTEFRAGIPVR